MRIRGTYGSYQLSNINKNAPLIFVVGGITMPTKGKVPPNYYAGDKLKGRNGYMWSWKNAGYDRLKKFNVYICYDQNNSFKAFKECVAFNKKYGISPEKYILVTFSAGVTTSHYPDGVLKNTLPNDWDMIILAGAYIKGKWSKYLKDYVATIEQAKNKVHYFTIGSKTKESEGATEDAKKVLIDILPADNVHVRQGTHGDQVKFTSDYIDQMFSVKDTNSILNSHAVNFDNINIFSANVESNNLHNSTTKKRRAWT